MMTLIKDRFKIGKERYSHGLLHKDNETMDFRKETVEELLDAVIYAASNCVRNKPQVSTLFAHDYDAGTVKLELRVNHETDHDDGESAIVRLIHDINTKKYDYSTPLTMDEHILLLCSSTLCFLLKHAK